MPFEPFPFVDEDKSIEVVSQFHLLCKRTENAAIYELVRGLHDTELPATPYVLEFGSYRGGSAACIGKALKELGEGVLMSVDPYRRTTGIVRSRIHEDGGKNFSSAMRHYESNGLLDHIVPIACRSVDFLSFWRNPIRFCFIDSLHTYEYTMQEMEAVMPFMMAGGWLCLHDYGRPDFQVTEAVDDFLTANSHYIFDRKYSVDKLACLCFAGVR